MQHCQTVDHNTDLAHNVLDDSRLVKHEASSSVHQCGLRRLS